MTLDVPAEYEEVIRNAVASGAFKTPEDAVRHALCLLEQEQRATQTCSQQSLCDAEVDILYDDIDPLQVATIQGVGPIDDPDVGAAETWPDNENIDEWLAELHDLRGKGVVREPQ